MAVAIRKRVPRLRTRWEFDGPKFLVIPPEAHTYSGFLKWVMSDSFPENLRVTYFLGDVSVDMSEENIDTQSNVKTAIYGTLLPLIREVDFGQFYTDGVLLCNEAADVSNNPDAVAARWRTLETKKLSFIVRKDSRRALEGTPDWVMEIVSDSSVDKDLRQLRTAYHRAGIEEYWIIDARGDEISFQILTWRQAGYVPTPNKYGWIYSRVFDHEFRLTRVRDRIGAWTYTLEVRPPSSKSKSR
jgi:Uma2 family endonuclease